MTNKEHEEFQKLLYELFHWCRNRSDNYCDKRCIYRDDTYGCALNTPCENIQIASTIFDAYRK